jgi:penicillin-binding protein 1A
VGQAAAKRVVADWVADEVTKILEENIDAGTGTNAGVFFSRPAAGKTGTTDEHTDAWFCGYTPNLSTTVWMGYPQGQVPMENVHGIQVAGGTFPTIIWNLFMRSAIGTTPEVDFPEPASEPTWVPFERGQYANDSYYDAMTTTTTRSRGARRATAHPPSFRLTTTAGRCLTRTPRDGNN